MGFFDAFSASNGKKAAQAGAFYAQQGKAEAGGLLDAARSNLTDNYGKAQALFAPAQAAVDRGMQGYGAYADGSGANGWDIYNRERDAFRASIAHQSQPIIDQINRGAAARGRLGSGGNEIDLARALLNNENQAYAQRMGWLAPFTSAPAQQIQLSGAQAGLQAGLGDKIAALFGQQAGNAMQTGNTMGQAMGNFYNANDVASKNMLGGALKGVDLLSSLFGMGGGMSGMFGGGGAPMNIKPTGMPTGIIY